MSHARRNPIIEGSAASYASYSRRVSGLFETIQYLLFILMHFRVLCVFFVCERDQKHEASSSILHRYI